METMCADDLLSVLLYLLVKTEIPNWYVNYFGSVELLLIILCSAAVGTNVSEHTVITY